MNKIILDETGELTPAIKAKLLDAKNASCIGFAESSKSDTTLRHPKKLKIRVKLNHATHRPS